MRKNILISAVAAVVVLGAVLWSNRAPLLAFTLQRIVEANRWDVAPYQPIEWKQGPSTASAPPSDRAPNIVFILLDDVGYNDISTFGGGIAGGRLQTPHIDSIAENGAHFLQAYSGSGTCAPSRAMLMTGRYGTRTGFDYTPMPRKMAGFMSVMQNAGNRKNIAEKFVYDRAADNSNPLFEDMGLPGSELTIAEVLQEQGYHTVHIGKWHLGRGEESQAIAQGFDESLMMHSAFYLPVDDPNVVNAEITTDPLDKFLWTTSQYSATFNGGEPFEPGGYLTDWWTDESLRVIEANKNRPFFLYLAHWGLHTPLQATKDDYEAVGDIEPHSLRVYAAMMRALDRSVGRIKQKLEEEGLAENTIIMISSDNGGPSYISLPEINAPYRGWKVTLFEGGIRVPFFMEWPAHIAQGTEVDMPVAHIDLMPTLASVAGATLPDDIIIDGQNILPAALGQGTITRPNDALFWQSGDYQVVRAGDWKLQSDGIQGKTWLFDLATDPTEQINLAEKRPEKVAELQALLDEHHKDAVKSIWSPTLIAPVRIDHVVDTPYEDGEDYILWPN